MTYPYYKEHDSALNDADPLILPQPLSVSSLLAHHANSIRDDMAAAMRYEQLWVVRAHEETQGTSLPQRVLELQQYLEGKAVKKQEWVFDGKLHLILYAWSR